MPWRNEAYTRRIVSQYGKYLLDLLLKRLQQPHDQLWDEITADEAPLARQAIIRAQEKRDLLADPGDAYLEGLAEGLGARRTAEDISVPIPRKTQEGIPCLKLITTGDGGGEVRPREA